MCVRERERERHVVKMTDYLARFFSGLALCPDPIPRTVTESIRCLQKKNQALKLTPTNSNSLPQSIEPEKEGVVGERETGRLVS